MCLTELATVVEHADGSTLVRLGTRERRVQNLLEPDVRPGDVVVVGMGLVLGRAPDDVRTTLDLGPALDHSTPMEAPR
jgi:hypothetical protein